MLAVGIVVDDAIVVVENVERNLRLGLSPRDAAHRTMDEVGGALLAIALTLCAVFIPSAFISGISGQFFRQFAVTIAASTIISCFVSLTLSPALCALLFLPHEAHAPVGRRFLPARLIAGFFAGFNRGFEWLSDRFGRLAARLIRMTAVVLVAYAGLIGLTAWQFSRAPTGFIPELDQGYLITVMQLPPGASLTRTDAVVREATQIILDTPGVRNAVVFAGLDGASLTNASNAGTIFSGLRPFEDRKTPEAERPRHPGVAAAAPIGDPGRVHHRAGAAPGQRHRQLRWVQDDDRGPAGCRRHRIGRGGAGHVRLRQRDARPGRRVHPVQQRHADGLRRHRPGARGEARRGAGEDIRGAAGSISAQPTSTTSTTSAAPTR